MDASYQATLEVENKGDKIILPERMSMREGIDALEKKIVESEKVVAVYETVDAYPLDGAHAFQMAMARKFGWATAEPTPGFFGPTPPVTIDVEVGFRKSVKVTWGGFKIPGVDGQLQTGVAMDGRRQVFCIQGKVKQKDLEKVKQLADLTRQIVREESIYKGKAFRLTTTDEGELDQGIQPKFLDLSNVNDDELVFPAVVQEQIVTSIWTPIERTAECRAHGIPLKRGVLLEGPYGCGKTLTAYVTAKKASTNGWTFIYLDRVTGLREALQFASRYAPAVVFAEDIDRILDGERDVKVDDVLNIIDGVDSKGAELITILTTNFVEKIEKAMLRPGRLDAVISVKAPDAEAAKRLVRIYARGRLAEGEDLTEVGTELAGHIPAVIREAVERSKLYAISHTKKGETLHLTGQDVAAAARGMKNHLELIKGKTEPVLTPREQLGHVLGTIIEDQVDTHFKGLKDDTEAIRIRLEA